MDSKIILLILRWLKCFCPERLYEEIAGDLIQRFHRDLNSPAHSTLPYHYKLKRAKLRLIWNAIGFFRPEIVLRNKMPSFRNSHSLTLHHFSTAYRSMFRNRLYSLLNIVGLALGMAAFLFIIQYVAYEKSYDKFHSNHENLYRVTYENTHIENNEVTNSATVPPRFVLLMKEMMPEVVAYSRVRPFPGLVVSYQDVKLRQDLVLMVDPGFLTLFTFPLISGDPKTALKNVRTVVITERAAKKYFGEEPALGKIIGIDGNKTYTITGVVKNPPDNSHLKFDFLISYETIKWWSNGEAETSWSANDYYGYVRLNEGTDVGSVDRRFNEIVEKERGKINRMEGRNQQFDLQPVADIHLYSKLDKELAPEQQGDSNTVLFLLIIAFFILIIAWINYINLFTARSIERSKEVGVRKTIGALRSQLIVQFIAESFLMNSLAVVVAVIAVMLGLSYFNTIANTRLTFNFLTDAIFWKSLVMFLFAGSFIAGFYPAFVLSSFRPAAALKGKLKLAGSGVTLRRSLVLIQFIASISLIAGTMIVYLQLNHLRQTDLGFDMTKLMVVRGPGATEEELSPAYQMQTATFINELLRYPAIKSVTGGSMVPGKEIFDEVFIKKHEDPVTMFRQMQSAWVGYDFFSTLGIKLIAGRSFDPARSDSLSLILNSSAVKALGFASPEEAINKKISIGTRQVWTLIGVTDDFNQMSLHNPIRPMFFSLYTVYAPNFVVRFERRPDAHILSEVKKSFEKFYPRDPFDYFFLDEFFNHQYHEEERFSNIFVLFAILAIGVSCLGLFGLSSFITLQRTKEIGIRKVFGASSTHIAYLLSKEFFRLVCLANVIAWPLIYLIMEGWLSNYSDRIEMPSSIFFISGFLVMAVALVTVSYKTILAAAANPVETLRHE